MPYSTTSDLPANVKSKYPEHAQRIYMDVFNQVMKDTGDEPRAFAAAAAAANKVSAKESEPLVAATFREGTGEAASFQMEGTFHEAETSGDGTTTVPVTIIKPGLSGNKFYYSTEVLSGLVPLLEGAKAYRNHETKSEVKDRGGRSIDDILGWYTDAKQEEDGRISSNLHLVETPYTEHAIKMIRANPSLVGLSINAKGIASRGKVEGKSALIAESFEKLYSTDLVTEAAAGGEVRMVASVVMDIDTVTDDNTHIRETEVIIVTDDEKVVAAWLLAEMKESGGELEGYKQTAEWLMAERSVAVWLAAEAAEVKRVTEADAQAKVIESLIADVPESLKPVAQEMDREQLEKFVEAMKAAPASLRAGGTPATPDAQPGQEGYKRHFFSK